MGLNILNIPWWRHQMEPFSVLLAICARNSPVPGEFPAQRPVTRSFDVFFIYVWINGCVNNREAGDLRRHRAHYDVIVMLCMNTVMWNMKIAIKDVIKGEMAWYTHMHMYAWGILQVLTKPHVLSIKQSSYLKYDI